jgi:hypothetical protein
MSWGIQDQYDVYFVLTIILLAIKASIVAYLASRIIVERRAVQKTPLGLIYAGMICIGCFFISRLFYTYFDFFLTSFNSALYPYWPTIFFWKAGTLIQAVGFSCVMWGLDKHVMLFKFKGILVIAALITAFVQFFYPIREGSVQDFDLVSLIGLPASLFAFILIIVFLWIGKTTPGIRKWAWLFAFGVLIYVLGNAAPNKVILNEFLLLGLSRNLVYGFSIGSKIAGLLMLTYSLGHIREVNAALVEYYQAKRICIVHRGEIEGPVFMCATCHVFYCVPCKEAILAIENSCWNCKTLLVEKQQGSESKGAEAAAQGSTSDGEPATQIEPPRKKKAEESDSRGSKGSKI